VNNEKVKEPKFHIVKRDSLSTVHSWGIRLGSIVAALIFCAVIIVLLTHENPISIYATMIKGAIGSSRRVWALMQSVAMLLCVSLAVTPAFKMKFWNIGAEGQVLIGGLATTACMILFGEKLPTYILIPLIIVSSMLAAAVWAVIPAVFKATWNTNETLFTLMMNYIAIQIVSYFAYIWSVPKGSGAIGVINGISHKGWLPEVFSQKYFLNIAIVAVLTIIIYVYLRYSKHGYEIAVVGESENTAKYIGINVKKVIIRTMILSGALCGIAGFLLVSGTDHTLTKDTAAGRGFTAIIVSWLAKFNPIYMVLTSLLIVFLQKGAIEIASVFGLNDSFSDIITGIIIFFIIGSEFFINYRIKLNKKEENA
jgi:simple sugar transport system permease protein